MKYLSIIFFSFLFVACGKEKDNMPPNLSEFGELGFSVELPDKLHIYKNMKFASTIPEPNEGGYVLNGDEIAINDTDLSVHDEETNCDTLKMGVTDYLVSSQNNDQLWGKVNSAYLSPYNRPIDGILCLPPTQGCTQSAIWSGKCNFGQAAFSLCAKKDKKTVVLCIRQIHENQEVVKRIFESFRWTE